jgi:hypothetical protein
MLQKKLGRTATHTPIAEAATRIRHAQALREWNPSELPTNLAAQNNAFFRKLFRRQVSLTTT